MTFVCGAVRLPDDIPDAGGGVCCQGAALDGPTGCECWTAVYDLEQAPVTPADIEAPGGLQPAPCQDCAYSAGSPERSGDDRFLASGEGELDALVHTATPFYCHQGIRRLVQMRHPSGVVYTAGPGAYDPPIRTIEQDGRRYARPHRADGTPALLCAGWMARVLALSGPGRG